MTYMIGIDSGGTHIVGTAWGNNGEQLAQVTAGPGNIFLDENGTRTHLKQVIAALRQQVSGDCRQILIGIAGVETTGNAETVQADFAAWSNIPTAVISDAQLALLNGLEGADGTLVIAGTGSIVYGRQNGAFSRFGGWGQLLGDTGSAYKIAEVAMIQALAAYDRGQDSSLIGLMEQNLNATSMKAAVSAFYQLSREKIAGFAAHLATAAANGDAAAQAVFDAQAKALAEEICGLIDRYQAPRPMALALSGSVLVHNEVYRQAVVAAVRARYPQVEPLVVTTNNSRGVLFWAQWHQA